MRTTMEPIYFKQATKLDNGNGKSLPLHYWSDNKQCVSCWKLSFKERVKLLFKGTVWLGIGMSKQPPVFISSNKVFS
jgi:hypothetical protein